MSIAHSLCTSTLNLYRARLQGAERRGFAHSSSTIHSIIILSSFHPVVVVWDSLHGGSAASTPTCSFYASCDVASFPTCLKTKKSFCPWVSIIALAYGLPSEELKRLRVRTDSFFNTRLIKLTKGPFRTVRFPLGNYARGPVSNTDPNIHVDTVVSSKRKNSNSQSESKSPSHRFQLVGGGGDGVTIHTKDNYAPHLLCLNATLSPHFEREKEREWFQSAE